VQKHWVDEYGRSIPYVGKHTNKVIKAFKKCDVNVEIKNKPSMSKRISHDQMEERD
jgi:hypothetical protein